METVTRPSTRLSIRGQLRETVIEHILDATELEVLALGFEGGTVAAVAARAGVAVGTLYNYFADLEAIIAQLFRVRRASLEPLIKAAVETTRRMSFEHRLRELVRRLVLAFEQHERFLRIAVLADRDGVEGNRDVKLKRNVLAALEDVMRAGVRARLFPPSRVTIYAQVLHGSLRSMFVWGASTGRPSFSTDAEVVVDVFLRGVLRAEA
jgi:AcrR family transcriptional regulator